MCLDSTAFVFLRDKAIFLLHWGGPGLLENQPWAVVPKGDYGMMAAAGLPGGMRTAPLINLVKGKGPASGEHLLSGETGRPLVWVSLLCSTGRPPSLEQQLLGVEGEE